MTLVTVLLLFLLLIGMPMAAAFAVAVFLNADQLGIRLANVGNIPYESVSSFVLVSIPLFILVGELMNRGGIAESIAQAMDRLLRRFRAAFGYIMVGSSAFLGAITGSSVATVAAIGSVVGPEMKRRGYPAGYVAALNAAAGLLGVLIPPSIPLILYGSIVGVSITQLFLATVAPGVLMMIAFAIVHRFLSKRVLVDGRETPQDTHSSDDAYQRKPVQLGRGLAALMMPVIVLGGIYGGFFTPTEAAAVACVYAFALVIIQRSLSRSGMMAAMYTAAVASAAILLIIAMSDILNRVLILNQIPQDLAVFVTQQFSDPITFLIAVNVLLLIVGTFMETNAAVMLMGPLLAPSAAAFGIDPIHFAIVMVVNTEIGLITPPLAPNTFVAARTNDVPMAKMLPYTGWFLLASLMVLVVITFFPSISLWYRYI